MRLGILRNPASTGNRGRSAPALPPGAVLAETAGPRDCAEALMRLADAQPDLIVIDAGDGTIRDAITRLPAIFGEDWPALGAMPHGNTNLVAGRLGAIRPAKLGRLAAIGPDEVAPYLRRAPVLRIELPGRGATLRGFIAGWGAYAAATRIGRDEIGARHGAQVAAAAFATLRRALVGRDAGALRRGVACALRADGHPEVGGRRFLGIATTLPGRLIGPLAPFWGDGEGAIRWLDVLSPPQRLALAAPLIALGRPAGWMRRAGYLSGRTGQLELSLAEGGLVLDGEVVSGDDCLDATITADETVRWLDLRRAAPSTGTRAGG